MRGTKAPLEIFRLVRRRTRNIEGIEVFGVVDVYLIWTYLKRLDLRMLYRPSFILRYDLQKKAIVLGDIC